jgi:hypothetical protein
MPRRQLADGAAGAPNAKPVQRSKHARLCVYGDPGVGKTRLVGTSPGRVLIIRPPTDHTDALLPADRQRVEEVVVADWDDMNKLLDYLRMDGAVYDWVWVDSVSLLQDHLLDDLWDTVISEKPHRARYGLDKQEYGINMFRLGTWMRHVIGPDIFNFGFTGHAAVLLPSEDPEEDKKLMPWVQGKNMSSKFCGYTNATLFMEVATIGGKEGRRVLRANATDRYYAKDQFDMTDNGRVVDPTMPKIVKLIEKGRGVPLGTAPDEPTTTNNARPRRRVRRRT